MKQYDFERLKAICEGEGLYFDFDPVSGDAVIAKKTDPFEGVEFVECVDDSLLSLSITKGRIYKRRYSDVKGAIALEGVSGCIQSTRFKPSTESAYVEQLKKEAFERFGEIKEGDRFNIDNGAVGNTASLFGVSKYYKEDDCLYLFGVNIYQQGKWAERVKERVEVEVISDVVRGKSISLTAQFSKKAAYRLNELESFLSQQIEKYLNGEIE